MIYLLIMAYLLCGVGVSMAIADRDYGLWFPARVFIFLVTLTVWPGPFTFLVLMAARTILEGRSPLKVIQ